MTEFTLQSSQNVPKGAQANVNILGNPSNQVATYLYVCVEKQEANDHPLELALFGARFPVVFLHQIGPGSDIGND